MTRTRFKSVSAIIALLMSSGAAQAAYISYNYVGNTFDTFTTNVGSSLFGIADSITASITVDCDSLSVVGNCTSFDFARMETHVTSWTISSGGVTVTNLDSATVSSRISIGTNVGGEITQWSLNMFGPVTLPAAPGFGTSRYDRLDTSSGNRSFDSVSSSAAPIYASIGGNPGQWTASVTAVPEPATAWLFSSALLGLGWLRRKKCLSKLNIQCSQNPA